MQTIRTNEQSNDQLIFIGDVMMTKQERIDEFKNKFSDLLNEYGAEISFDSGECSDLYGIYAPKIVVTIRDPDNFRNEIVVLESNGYAL